MACGSHSRRSRNRQAKRGTHRAPAITIAASGLMTSLLVCSKGTPLSV